MRAAAAAACALLTAASCVQVQWVRSRAEDPIPLARAMALSVGTSDLDQCLHELGAPHVVGLGPEDTIELVYGWTDEVAWGVSVSYDVTSWFTASFTYNDRDQHLEGVVLRFCEDLVLRRIGYGCLKNLRPGGRDPTRARRSRALPESPGQRRAVPRQ